MSENSGLRVGRRYELGGRGVFEVLCESEHRLRRKLTSDETFWRSWLVQNVSEPERNERRCVAAVPGVFFCDVSFCTPWDRQEWARPVPALCGETHSELPHYANFELRPDGERALVTTEMSSWLDNGPEASQHFAPSAHSKLFVELDFKKVPEGEVAAFPDKLYLKCYPIARAAARD